MIDKDTTSELHNLALCLFLKHVAQTCFEFVALLPLPPKISEIISLYNRPGYARYDIYVYVYLTIFAFLIKLIPIMFFIFSYE